MLEFNFKKDKAKISGSVENIIQESAWLLYNFYRDIKKQNKEYANLFKTEFINNTKQIFLSDENFSKLLKNMNYKKDSKLKIICKVDIENQGSEIFDYRGDLKNIIFELIILIRRIYKTIKSQYEEGAQIYKDTLIENLHIPFDEIDKED